MERIKDLLTRDLNRRIEEIIKVDQADEQTVRTELTEYVVTDRIRDEYRQLLSAIAEGPSEPTEGIGVWISGFFGSGKSSFAKNLGYVLSNREVVGEPAAELFKRQCEDLRISSLVDNINARIPTEVVMFDVSVVRSIRTATERIAEVMYRALLRRLDYAEDFDIAELEIELEGQGRLDEFVAQCEAKGWNWKKDRKGAFKIPHASAILHEMDPDTFPSADSWSRSLGAKGADINVARFVDRAFELTRRRRPDKALVFIVDEVGQYVAHSADKIEDLRAVVEHFGQEGKNRLKRGEIAAPAWVVVTSQEKLDEVVAALDSRRVDIAKLQDRFRHRVDLAPSDIREVATRRVLAKHPDAVPELRRLFSQHQGQLNVACRLERTSRKSEVREDDFVQFYPYLPHFIDLSIDIMSGLRLQPGAPRHLGGSNRTIIKQAYEMLVSDRTRMAERPIGTLVSLDLIFELVEGNLSTERQKDIGDIAQRFKDDAQDNGWASRVAKAISLLEFVRDLPRTEMNIAAVLVDGLGKPAPLAEVNAALERLIEAQFVRNTEEGYKLQTAQEKNWETERRSYLGPKPKDRNEIVRGVLTDLFAEPYLKIYRFKDLRSFRVGITVDGTRIGDEGQVPLSLLVAEAPEELADKLEEARTESRSQTHRDTIYWVCTLTPEIDHLVENLYASRQMVTKYDQMRAQNKITNEEASSLTDEKGAVIRLQSRLREKLAEALSKGQGMFRGYAHDASDLGKSPREIFKQLFDATVPDLYPKLQMGARALRGDEVSDVLKAANLNALPQVFYGGEGGLNLVTQDGAKYVPNPHAEIAKEVLDYMRREHSYGNKVTGRSLEDHFGGIGYGWDGEILRLVLAVLLRGGYVEVTYQGQRFRNAVDPQCRVPFEKIPAFRSASFAPRESIGLKTLTSAVEHYEELTGEEVDVEEAAIASAFKKLADEETQQLHQLSAVVQAHHLPVAAILEEYRQTLASIVASASDDCVRILAGEGNSFKEARNRVRQIRNALKEANLEVIDQARMACGEMWPVLASRGGADLREKRDRLQALITADDFYAHLHDISNLTIALQTAYRTAYGSCHAQRFEAFSQAVEEIKGLPDWPRLPDGISDSVLAPLISRLCETVDMPADRSRCRTCEATFAQMESDIAALNGLRSQARLRLEELIAPPDGDGRRTVKVRSSDFFPVALESTEAVKEAVDRLRDHLLDLIAEDARVVVE